MNNAKVQINRILLPVILLLAIPSSLHAQLRYRSHGSNDNYHFAYISGAAGYTMLSSNQNAGIIDGDWGGSLGLGYEFRLNSFWASVGAQFSRHQSSIALYNYKQDFDGIAHKNQEVILHYDVQQTDEHRWNAIDVPILFGYYKYGFYVGAGAKVGYFVMPETRSYGTYELSATHKQTQVVFQNMPNHGYTTYQYDYRHNTKLTPQIAIIGEIGYDLLSAVPTRSALCHILKLGFYFEYGLNSLVTPQPEATPVVPAATDATQADILPHLGIAAAQGLYSVPFFTGVRLTYAIGGSRTAHRGSLHHGCMCYQ